MGVKLDDYQLDAVSRIKNGCILNGGVGSGKSRTGLAYYFTKCGGKLDPFERMTRPMDLYIITTAQKRDRLEWEDELVPFLLTTDEKNLKKYGCKVTIDSWNNITKYSKVQGAFFIFDEDKVTGNGVWVKTFLTLAKRNDWIILSATPGDVWKDYIPVFMANGFYRTRTEFYDNHVIWARFVNYPKIQKYMNTKRLEKLRDSILINMDFQRDTIRHHEDIYVDYDVGMYKFVTRERWDPYENKPIKNAAGLYFIWRKIVNSDQSRQVALMELLDKHPRVIVFYNFDYELDILRNLYYGDDVVVAEWNGHKHEPIPDSKRWVYLVNYAAGAEGWNCTETDTVVFYSQNYSYRVVEQASGRIDRRNTPYKDLYYYHLKSRSQIDMQISRALHGKKDFNERKIKFDVKVSRGVEKNYVIPKNDL